MWYRPFILWAFHLLYNQMAWSYDLVSWLVSMGQWRAWQGAGVAFLTGRDVLELAHGPGHMLIELKSADFHITDSRVARSGRPATAEESTAGLVIVYFTGTWLREETVMLSDGLVKALSAAAVLLAILGVILIAVFTHGQLWSVQSLRYKLILESLPEPPGLLLETRFVQAFPDYPLGYSSFNVKGQYSETVSFFTTEVSKQGWNLFSTDVRGPTNILPGEYGSSTTLRFINQSNYCLKIGVVTATDQEGSQLDDEISVNIQIWDNIECKEQTG